MGEIETSFIISTPLKLDEAAIGYKMFQDDQDEVTTVVLTP